MKEDIKVASKNHPIVEKKIEKSLNLSVKEGAISSVSANIGLTYLSPFALAMNATSSQVGILHAIINLFPSLAQIWSSKLLQKQSRKKIVLRAIFLESFFWIPLAFAGVLYYFDFPYVVWTLIGIAGLVYSSHGTAIPAWFSWMGSLVSENNRGKYFSKRNRLMSLFGLLSLIFAAYFLDFFKEYGLRMGDVKLYTMVAFIFLFLIASITRFCSFLLLSRQYEPRLIVRKKDYFSFWQFLKRCPETPFGRFSLFRGFFSIAVGVAIPFWDIYLLRDLGFSYVWFIAVTVSKIIFEFLFLPLLGKISDKFGNINLIRLCSWIISAIPLLWFASYFIPNPLAQGLYLIIVPPLFSGFAWAGYLLASNNYVYDAVNQRKTSYGISYMNLLVGFGTFIGALIGSAIALFDFPFLTVSLVIFLLSAVIRLVVAEFGLKKLKEVRHVKKFYPQYIIREFRPFQGSIREVHHVEHYLKKKIQHYI